MKYLSWTASAVAFSLSGFLSRSACAGQWVISHYEVHGDYILTEQKGGSFKPKQLGTYPSPYIYRDPGVDKAPEFTAGGGFRLGSPNTNSPNLEFQAATGRSLMSVTTWVRWEPNKIYNPLTGQEDLPDPLDRPQTQFLYVRERPLVAATREVHHTAGRANQVPSETQAAAEKIKIDVLDNPFGDRLEKSTGYGDENLRYYERHIVRASRIMRVPTYDSDLVAVPTCTMHAEVSVDGITWPNSQPGASVPLKGDATTQYQAQLSNRALILVGPTPTYHKSETLPMKANEQGNMVVDTDRIRPSATPFDPAKPGTGPWAVLNKPGVADVAAEWRQPFGSSVPWGWYGSASFEAQTTGFESSNYTWNVVGGELHEVPSEPHQRNYPVQFGTDKFHGIKLGSEKNGSDLAKSTEAAVLVQDADDTAADDAFTVNWHLPAEWDTNPIYTNTYYEDIAGEAIPGEEEAGPPGGSIKAKWKWKTAKAGQVPTPEDYDNDAMREAFRHISDILGVENVFDNETNKAIDDLKEPRTRLLLRSIAALGGKLYEENISEGGNVIGGASFGSVWNFQTPGGTPADQPQWVNKAGAKVAKPSPPAGLTTEQQQAWLTAEQGKWTLYNPRLLLEMQDRLFRGDAYDASGYEGRTHCGVTHHTGTRHYIGDFKRNRQADEVAPPPPADPQ